jgi:hypothetical protein
MECAVSDGGFPAGYPAAHGPFPVVSYQGGGLIMAPEVVTITFQGDTLAPQLEQFTDDILQTCWWDEVRAPFCSGTSGTTGCIQRGTPANTVDHVELTTPAAASYTDAQIQALIQQGVAAGTMPPPNANRIYTVFIPQTSSVSDQGLGSSCQSFGGYHSNTSVSAQGGTSSNVPYAVVAECAPQGFPSLFDETTFYASHEITEASTDPYPMSGQLGFVLNENNEDDFAWNFAPGGGDEVGDLCVDLIGQGQGNPHDRYTATGAHGSYMVQRIWNPTAAAAGGDPCGPIGPDDAPYFNLAIPQGSGVHTVAVGSSVTFPVTAFSTGPVTSWLVAGYDWASVYQGQPSTLTITPSQTTVTNGDQIMVTVTLNSMPPEIANGVNGAVFVLLSQSGSTLHTWSGLIVAN